MKNIVILFGLPVLAAMTSFAGNVCTWSGRAGNGSWKDAGNWDTKPVDGNGDTVVLVNTGAEAITIDNDIGAMSLYSLRFGAGSTAPITLTGGTLTLTSTGGSDQTVAGGEASALYDAVDTIEMTVACPVELPSGTHCFTIGEKAKLHISGVISGKGGFHRHGVKGSDANGAGTLTLSAANTFEGGVTLRSATTVLSHVQALGKAGKTINMFYPATYNFEAAGDWDYVFGFKEGAATFNINADVRFLRSFTEFGNGTTCTFKLGGTAKRVDFMGKVGIGDAPVSANVHKFTFDCPTGASLYFHDAVCFGDATRTGSVTFGKDDNARKGWDAHFLAAGNDWTAPINAKFANLHFHAANAFHEGESPVLDYPRQENMGCYHIHGTDQTIAHLSTEQLESKYIADTGRYFSTDTAAILTLKGDQNASANVAFMGPLTVVYDAQGNYVQAITNRTNGMIGDIIVSNGTFRACGTTSFKNAHAIRVTDGGTFELDSSTAGALANVKSVNVEDGGVFRVSPTTPNPFSGGNAVNLAIGGVLETAGTLTFQTLIFVDGVAVANGRYQSQTGTDATAVRVDWLRGSGVVTTSVDGSHWRTAADGVWDEASNWTTPPVADGAVFINADGADDYTVTVAADTVPVKSVEIHRGDSGLATLAVGAMLETFEGTTSFGAGARVSVGEDGLWKLTSKDEYSTATKFSLSDGAVFSVDGGSFLVPNFGGMMWLGDNNGTANGTNTLRVTDGLLDIQTRQSADSGVRLFPNGLVAVSGGTARFYTQRASDQCFRNDRGGTLEVSGEGRLELGGNVYFQGSQRFSGNARLSAVKEKNSPVFYVNPLGAGKVATLEFADHAGVDPTGFATYGGVEGAYMFGQLRANQDIDDGLARIRFLGDGLYQFNSSFELAIHRGRAEVEQTGGFFRTYSDGIAVGTCLYAAQSTAPNAEAVWRVSGGAAEIRAANAYSRNDRMSGLLIGNGTYVTEGKRGRITGRFELSGGAVTNMTYESFFGVGLGDACGEVIQTGGEFVKKDAGWVLIGFAGGEGRYVMSNGVAKVSGSDVWLGGAPQSSFVMSMTGGGAKAMSLPACPDSHEAKGLLRVWGGSFDASTRNMYLGCDGTGRIEVGPTGRVSAKNLVLSNAVAGVATSSLRFEFDADGVGQVAVGGKLTVKPGSKLEIDVGNYSAQKSGYNVVTYDELEGTFAPENITLTGDPELLEIAKVRIGGKSIRVSMPRSGVVIIVR